MKQVNSQLLMNKEVKNASWIIVCKVLRMIVALFISIIIARYLGPEEYGIINYAVAFVTFFSAVSALGINSIIIKDFVEFPKDRGSAIGTAILMRLGASALSIILIAFLVYIIDYGERLTIQTVILCSFALLFQSFDTYNYWFQFQYKSKVSSIAGLIGYSVSAVYKIILLILNKNILWFAFATSIDYIIEAIVLYYVYVNDKKNPRMKLNFKVGKRMIKQSYHYILSSMMVTIYGQTDKLMLKQMIGSDEVGYYSLAMSVNSMWVFVLQAIIDAMYPSILRLYNSDKKQYKKKNVQLYSIVIFMSLFVGVAFTFLGEFAIVFLYGEEYLPSATILKIIVWYTMFSYLGVARNAWLVSEGVQKYLKYIYMVAVFFNIGLNSVMIPILGAEGAAYASLITQVMTSLIVPSFLPKLRPNVKLMLEAFIMKGFRKEY